MLFAICSNGQIAMQYNININNGLPSDHVYWVNVDRYGYLWISTENGIVKYNGYQSRVYNLLDGMPNCDIWGAIEDKKGRMWLYSISNDIGYIYKDKYKKAYIKDTFPRIYPRQIQEDSTGIIFLNPSNHNPSAFTLCKERNDTIYDLQTENIIRMSDTDLFGKQMMHRQFLSDKNELLEVTDKYILKIDFTHHPPGLIKLCTYPKDFFSNKKPSMTALFGSYIITCNENINILNYKDSSTKKILLNNLQEHFITITDNAEKIYVHSNRATYIFNEKMDLIETIHIDSLLKNRSISGSNFIFLFDNDFWQRIIGTTDNGLYINFYSPKHFIKAPYDLTGYKYVGITKDSTCCWWNKSKLILACINKKDHITYHKFGTFYNVKKIVPYNNTRSLLLADDNTYWLENGTKKITPLFKDYKYFIDLYSKQKINFFSKNMLFTCRDVVVAPDTSVFFISYIPSTYNCKFSHDSVFANTIDYDRETGIVFDSLHNDLWTYSDSKVMIYHRNTNKFDTLKNIFNSLGLRNVEKILIDNKYGNVFLKDFHKLFIYNYPSGDYRELFTNYRLDNTRMMLYNNTLVISGSFGILTSKIDGVAKIEQPILYENVKNVAYNYVSGMHIINANAIINSDNGTYSVRLSDTVLPGNEKDFSSSERYKFILTYADSTRRIHTWDTVNMTQKNHLLQFDIINPYGNGTLKYQYKIQDVDSDWRTLNSNELHINELPAGKYYTLSVMAYDNVWKSNEMKLHIFIIPYWWQTSLGKKLLAAILIIILIVLVFSIVIITNRVITKKNLKKNLLLELELRSIYAQINPHFIFNTLGAALSFIDNKKLDEAYTHISKFSRLLRAYLKSSRNKLIAVKDEITNLRNYIDLQRTRFDNKFDYDIVVDDNIDIEKTYLPSLLLQPIVENAITHGLFHMDSGGNLRIDFKYEKANDTLICIINDNGVGREQAKLIEANSELKRQSYGDQLVKDLIRIFNDYEKMHVNIIYEDKQLPETGTIVYLCINNPHHE